MRPARGICDPAPPDGSPDDQGGAARVCAGLAAAKTDGGLQTADHRRVGLCAAEQNRGELLFELISQRYERGSTLITSNLPFDEWTETFGSERLTGELLDRLTHHVNILEMNGESYRLGQSKARQATPKT